MDLVLKEWWTDVTGKTDAQGVFATRGFLGDYEISVGITGGPKTKKVKLTKDGVTVKVVR
jgi:hypothetical protein